MRMNLWGEFQIEPKDFVNTILEKFKKQSFCKIYTNNTKRGFERTYHSVLPDVGVYCIYKYEQPIYIGATASSIYNRISRFIAGVKGTETQNESHSAAYKYLRVYGTELDDISIKYCEIDLFSLPVDIKLSDIERELIYTMKPVFNQQIYNNLFVSKSSVTIG